MKNGCPRVSLIVLEAQCACCHLFSHDKQDTVNCFF
jgi:hypothetical protein